MLIWPRLRLIRFKHLIFSAGWPITGVGGMAFEIDLLHVVNASMTRCGVWRYSLERVVVPLYCVLTTQDFADILPGRWWQSSFLRGLAV